MSLARMVYWTALLGGWAAFAGWAACEFAVLPAVPARWQPVAVGGVIGAAIAAAVGAVAGLTEGRWRAVAGLAGGLVGGAVGGLVGGAGGQLLYAAGVPRAVGWMLLGLGIGGIDGLVARSARRARNGLIGGAVGGLVGGLVFDPISRAGLGETGMASRAAGFVILGLMIGALIGLAQVVFREAWVTVVDGFRVGRQLLLTRPVTVMGRAEHLPLPFLGTWGTPLELEHARIERRADGRFVVVDAGTKTGTRVNDRPINGPVELADGDIIRLGSNYVRFNEQRRRPTPAAAPAVPPPPAAPLPYDDFDLAPAAPRPRPRPAAPAPVAPPTPPKPAPYDDDFLPAAPRPQPAAAPPRPAPPMAKPAPPAPPPRPPVPAPVARPTPPARPPAPPAPSVRPPAPPTPVAKPAPPPPPPVKPAAPVPVTAKPATPAAPAASPGGCPKCKRSVPGSPGSRYCLTCDITF